MEKENLNSREIYKKGEKPLGPFSDKHLEILFNDFKQSAGLKNNLYLAFKYLEKDENTKSLILNTIRPHAKEYKNRINHILNLKGENEFKLEKTEDEEIIIEQIFQYLKAHYEEFNN